MKTYIAKRSFYGDLGSVRRRQELKIDDERLAKQLVEKGLIAPASGTEPEAVETPKPTTKPKAKS